MFIFLKEHDQNSFIHLPPGTAARQVWWAGPRGHLEELGSGVRGGTAERVQLAAHRELVTEAKVGYFDVHVGVQQEVLCLEDRKDLY